MSSASIPIPNRSSSSSSPARTIDALIPISLSPTSSRTRILSTSSNNDPRRANIARSPVLIGTSVSPTRSTHIRSPPSHLRSFQPRIVRAEGVSRPSDHPPPPRTRRISSPGVGVRGTSASRSSLHPAATPYVRPSYLDHSSFRHLLQEETSRGRTGDYSTIAEPVHTASSSSRRRTHTPSEDSDEDEGSSNAPEEYQTPTTSISAESPMLILPTRWGETFRHHVLSVSQDGREISFQGPINSSAEKKEAAAARTNYPIPAACGIYYFEVEIVHKGGANKGHISVGFSGPEVKLNRLPGWEKHSWGYHTDTGCCCAAEKEGTQFGPICGIGDIIGCGIDFSQHKAFYTKNGNFLGYVFDGIGRGCDLYPSVGLRYPGEIIRANFGHEPFKFDIDYMVQQQRHSVWDRILHTPTNSDTLSTVQRLAASSGDSSVASSALAPDATKVSSEQDFKAPLHSLVLSYLIHHGHSKTTRALQAQCRNTDAISPWTIESPSTDVDMDAAPSTSRLPDSEDIDVRTRAVDAVTKGDIDTALKQTEEHFPSLLLDDDGLVLFKLKCRKFIELILGTAELKKRMDALLAAERASIVSGTAENIPGEGDEMLDDNIDMDVDEESSASPTPPVASNAGSNGISNGNGFERPRRMSTRRFHSSASNDAVAAYEAALTQAISYGQLLQKDYAKDKREEVKKLFKRTFSIVAYHDPISAGPETLAIVGQEARAALANELNQAILKSQGRPAQPPLETMYRRAAASLLQLGLLGEGAAAFADIQKELLDS